MTTPANREIFTRMLRAMGSQDWDECEQYLADDLLAEWAYAVVPGFPTELVGRNQFRATLEGGMKSFASYNYQIIELHDMANADQLIAEYTSHSRYLPRDVPYSNRYIGILYFSNSKITRWREYVNPMAVFEAMGPDYDRVFSNP